MFKIDDFFKIFDYINGEEDVDLDSSVKVLASSELAKTNLLFENTIDQAAFSSSDYRRLRKFLIHLYAAHKTLTTIQKDASKLYFLPSEHIDELFRSFGFPYSYDVNSITNKVNFFLDLVNIYKRKGSPSSLVSVLRYFGVYDSNIVEYFLERTEEGDLIFEPHYIESALESPTLHRRAYHDMVDIDPHWFQTEDEIKKLHDENIISLPSKSPFLGIGPHINLNDVNLLISYFRRFLKDLLDDYRENDNEPSKDINIARFGVSASILDLYLAISYIMFQLQDSIYDPNSRNVLLNNISDDIDEDEYFDGYKKLVNKVDDRDDFNDRFKKYTEDYTIPFSEICLDSTATTEAILNDLNPTLKSEIDVASDVLVDVLSFLSRDLAEWLNRNIEIDAPNIATIISGFAESIGSLKDIINFIIPYRVRFLPLAENLLITNRLFNTIFTGEEIHQEIEQKDYDSEILRDAIELQLQRDIEEYLSIYDSSIFFNVEQIPFEQFQIEEESSYKIEQLAVELPHVYNDYDESDKDYFDLGLLQEHQILELQQKTEVVYKRGNSPDDYDSGIDYDLSWNDFAILTTIQLSNSNLNIDDDMNLEFIQKTLELPNYYKSYDLDDNYEEPIVDDKLNLDIDYDVESDIFRIKSGYEDTYEYDYETDEDGDVVEVLINSGFSNYDEDISFDESYLKQVTEIFVEEV